MFKRQFKGYINGEIRSWPVIDKRQTTIYLKSLRLMLTTEFDIHQTHKLEHDIDLLLDLLFKQMQEEEEQDSGILRTAGLR